MSGYIMTPGSGVPVGKDNPLPSTLSNETNTWIIPNGTNVSNSYVDFEGRTLVALSVPSGYAGGNITFQASDTPTGTYQDVYDSNGIQVTITVGGASRVVSITGVALQALASLQYVKIKCTTNVTADRTITAIMKG